MNKLFVPQVSRLRIFVIEHSTSHLVFLNHWMRYVRVFLIDSSLWNTYPRLQSWQMDLNPFSLSNSSVSTSNFRTGIFFFSLISMMKFTVMEYCINIDSQSVAFPGIWPKSLKTSWGLLAIKFTKNLCANRNLFKETASYKCFWIVNLNISLVLSLVISWLWRKKISRMWQF